MTITEAQELKNRLDRNSGLQNTVVRILPEEIDPPRDGDNGYDVETTVNGVESTLPGA